MPKRMKECRVCGNQYAACNSARTGSPIFNWREVACSPECGEVYLELVRESRAKVRDVESVDKFSVKEDRESDLELDAEYVTTEFCSDQDECGDEPF